MRGTPSRQPTLPLLPLDVLMMQLAGVSVVSENSREVLSSMAIDLVL